MVGRAEVTKVRTWLGDWVKEGSESYRGEVGGTQVMGHGFVKVERMSDIFGENS